MKGAIAALFVALAAASAIPGPDSAASRQNARSEAELVEAPLAAREDPFSGLTDPSLRRGLKAEPHYRPVAPREVPEPPVLVECRNPATGVTFLLLIPRPFPLPPYPAPPGVPAADAADLECRDPTTGLTFPYPAPPGLPA